MVCVPSGRTGNRKSGPGTQSGPWTHRPCQLCPPGRPGWGRGQAPRIRVCPPRFLGGDFADPATTLGQRWGEEGVWAVPANTLTSLPATGRLLKIWAEAGTRPGQTRVPGRPGGRQGTGSRTDLSPHPQGAHRGRSEKWPSGDRAAQPSDHSDERVLSLRGTDPAPHCPLYRARLTTWLQASDSVHGCSQNIWVESKKPDHPTTYCVWSHLSTVLGA